MRLHFLGQGSEPLQDTIEVADLRLGSIRGCAVRAAGGFGGDVAFADGLKNVLGRMEGRVDRDGAVAVRAERNAGSCHSDTIFYTFALVDRVS